ncbi:MAG: LON peptidase substrate-binding domain-containing protein [Lysobacteraceae bacterium]
MPANSLPLFPLHCVLVPGAQLQLRIFEPRYLDLVRSCCREGNGFGVCLILDGDEAGKSSQSMDGQVSREAGHRERPLPVAVGTEARIVDFDTLPDGLLGITVQGVRRFHVERTRVRDNGLIVADIAWLDEPEFVPLAIEHDLLATLLRRLIEQMGGIHARAATTEYEDARWVSWRLAEMLPIALADRQMLLQQSDPEARLQRLLELIPQLQEE